VTFVKELPKNCGRQDSEIYFESATARDRSAVIEFDIGRWTLSVRRFRLCSSLACQAVVATKAGHFP